MTDVDTQRKRREKEAIAKLDSERAERRAREDYERTKRNRELEQRRFDLMAIKKQQDKREAELAESLAKSQELLRQLRRKQLEEESQKTSHK